MDDLPALFWRARKESKLSDVSTPVGAVITNGGRVISYGHNKDKSHPLVKNKYSIHAEIDAILSRRYHTGSLEGATIYVYRETCSGDPAMARPCESCMRLIIEAGIRKVYYTINKYPYYKILIIRGN